jgi:ribosome maturation protein Sdo1
VLDGASNASLENEFGTKNEDEVIMKILEGGELKAGEVRRSPKEPCTPRAEY